MTILPAKRTAVSTEGANAQTGSADKSRRELNSHSPNIGDASKSGNRRTCRRSATPEPTDHCLRKRFKGSAQRARQQMGTSRNAKITTEENHESGNVSSSEEQIENVSKETSKTEAVDETGFNSEDEYVTPLNTTNHLTNEDWAVRDYRFAQCLEKLGYEIKQMNNDGACLFRAIADQVYGDQELHDMVRTSCMDYIAKNKDFFGPYVTEDFDKYIARKRQWNVHGNHLEIQAMSEMYNRTIEVYCYETKPINIFNGPRTNTDEPIRLSYHRKSHYNSICDPNKPSVGVGLGLPGYNTVDLNRRRLADAIRASDELLIEQTMLEDKLQATDWEATNEALEQAAARESYMQYIRDAEKRHKPQGVSGSSSSVTSAACSSVGPNTRPPRGSSPRPSACKIDSASIPSANESDGNFGHKPISGQSISQASTEYATGLYNRNDALETATSCKSTSTIGVGDLLTPDDWDEGIMAQVLADSRKTYMDDLMRNSKKLDSPGPSTSR